MAGNDKIHIQPPEESSGAPDLRIICRVCQKQWSKYACPRCNVRYCSLPCYKAHSNRCTEGFYRENAENQLRQTKAEPENRRKMLQTLKRMQEAEGDEGLGFGAGLEEGGDDSDMEDDGEGFEISEETLRRLSEKGDDLSLDDLSPDERAALRRAAASGALSRFIPAWEPWYLSPEAKQIRIGPTGTRAVREVFTPVGGALGGSHRTPAEEAFRKLMGGPADELNAEESGSEAPESSPMEILESPGGGSDIISKDRAAGLGGAEISPESPFSSVLGNAGFGRRGPSPRPAQSAGYADVSREAVHVSGRDADVIGGDTDLSIGAGPSVPAPPAEDLPPLSSLTRTPPSDLLGYHVTGVLYGYCYVMRLFNGEWAADPVDAAETLVAVAPVLSEGATPSSVRDALHGCLERACSPSLAGPGCSAFGRALMGDVTGLLSLGRPGVVCALADVHRILTMAQKGDRELSEGDQKERCGRPTGSREVTRGLVPKTVVEKLEGVEPKSEIRTRGGVQTPPTGKSARGEVESSREVFGKSSRKGGQKGGKGKGHSELVRRKVFFFLVWANEQSDLVFHALAAAASECWEAERARYETEQRGEGGRARTPRSGVVEEV